MQFVKFSEQKMDALSIEKGYIVHAVNCKGVVGGGIAKQVKNTFPETFEAYSSVCKEFGNFMLGMCALTDGRENVTVANLFTSDGYGAQVDSPESILQATKFAVYDFYNSIFISNHVGSKIPLKIYSNKFNSGLFNVPWEETFKVIEEVSNYFFNNCLPSFYKQFFGELIAQGHSPVEWVVCLHE